MRKSNAKIWRNLRIWSAVVLVVAIAALCGSWFDGHGGKAQAGWKWESPSHAVAKPNMACGVPCYW